MFRGFMDHWVPTVESISKFWKSDIQDCERMIDDLASRVAFNNFTFYTKWYTNGILSELDFLSNHPDASNVKTSNRWGRELIDHLHSRNMTCGAMMQCYMFEKDAWGEQPILGEWDVRSAAQTDGPCVLADFTQDTYRQKLAQMLREQLILFPDFDYLFLEFEGITDEMAIKAYRQYAQTQPDLPDVEGVSYREQDVALMNGIGVQVDFRCSQEALAMFRYYMHQNLQTAQSVCDELQYRGKLGVVYYPAGYEGLFMPDALPGSRWRLLPWCYFGWIEDAVQKGQTLKMLFDHIEDQLAKGNRVLYIGDVSIAPWDTDSIEKTIEFCQSHVMEGYLGMGNPDGNIGLKWLGVDQEQVRKAGEVFERLWK